MIVFFGSFLHLSNRCERNSFLSCRTDVQYPEEFIESLMYFVFFYFVHIHKGYELIVIIIYHINEWISIEANHFHNFIRKRSIDRCS